MHPHFNMKAGKSIRQALSLENATVTPPFNPKLAEKALLEALQYLKNRLHLSGREIANILHLPANTVNNWLKSGRIPITSSLLHPDIQAVIHLVAIHSSLEAMFEDPIHQSAWLSTLHPELNVIPLDQMRESIDGLIFIRQYLDYIRERGA